MSFKPTADFVGISSSRQELLQGAMNGYNQSHQTLIAAYNHSLSAAGRTDDLGVYYFLPKIADFFHIGIAQAYNTTSLLLLIVSWLIATVTLTLYAKSFKSKFIAITLSVVFLISMKHAYLPLTYLAGLSAALCVVPLSLYFKRRQKLDAFFLIFIVLASIYSGYLYFVRSFSSIPSLIILLSAILTVKACSFKRKILFTGILALCFSIAFFDFQHILYARDHYLIEKVHFTQAMLIPAGHPFWHSIYLGLGYLKNNPWHIQWNDSVAMNYVLSIKPGTHYLSAEYNQILKNGFFHAVESHPVFFIKQTLVKFVKACLKIKEYYLVIPTLLIIGFIQFKRAYKHNQVDLTTKHAAFLSALFFASLTGVLTIPTFIYLTGFTTIAYLYASIMLIDEIEYRIYQKTLR